MSTLTPDQVGRVPSFDGTEIAYQVFGVQGPNVVFGNGIGVGHASLRLQLEHLRRRFRVVCWDHRGVFGSREIESRDLSVEAHARDCLAVMDAASIDSAGYIGWSMGAQIGFEVLRLEPDRLARLACLSGVAGRIFRDAFPLPGLEQVFRWSIERLLPTASFVSPVAARLIRTRSFFDLARRAGYVGAEAHAELFMHMAHGVATLDHEIYLRILLELGRHDASAVLSGLTRPVLFVAGSRDRMTPLPRIRALAAAVPTGRVHVIEGGTHFALLEAPEEVNRALERFLSDDEDLVPCRPSAL